MAEKELIHVLDSVDVVVSPGRPCEIKRAQCSPEYRVRVSAQKRHKVVASGTENRLV